MTTTREYDDTRFARDRRFDAVGQTEIMELLGVTRSAVERYLRVGRRGHPFPTPVRPVGGRPAWHRPDVERWARASGATTSGGQP